MGNSSQNSADAGYYQLSTTGDYPLFVYPYDNGSAIPGEQITYDLEYEIPKVKALEVKLDKLCKIMKAAGLCKHCEDKLKCITNE